MEKDRSFDRLMIVSKVLMDARVAELRNENEMLRLQLFWKDNDVQTLQNIVRKANNGTGSPNCCCRDCWLYCRAGRQQLIETCTFIPWLECKIAECGLTFGYVTASSEWEYHMAGGNDCVSDADSHFVICNLQGSKWSMFTYGLRLWKAKTVNDPELKKLAILVEILHKAAFVEE
jgi:hypothetical protein